MKLTFRKAKKDNLKDVFYNNIDIKNSDNINSVFQKIVKVLI